MDKWSKKKATETCGGLGMSKYIDSNEARRLGRLKNIRSSLGSKLSHTGWQKDQIEKRRKEQLRQRKREAKKKQLGEGVRVETKASKADAVSKSGLKLKAATGGTSDAVQERRAKGLEAQTKLEADLRMRRRGDGRDNSRKPATSKLPLLGDRSNAPNKPALAKRNPVPKQTQRHVATQRFRPNEGKENSSDDSTKMELVAAEDTNGRALPKKHSGAKSKPKQHFTMSIDSLRKEHADAIKMLEELDQREGHRRRSLDSDSSGNSSYDSGAASFGSQPNYKASNTLDDDFVKDCSARDGDDTGEAGHAVSESFLNMSHLSISLRDDFDGGGREASLTPTKKDRSFSLSEGTLTPTHTPTRNRSFTPSCASIEDGDFFGGDADVESGTSEENDDGGYSSGTF